MPYFHATRRQNLPSILAHGLGGRDPGANSEACERGVYLAADPRLSLLMMILHYLNGGPDQPRPADELEQWVVLLVDDARIDCRLLRPDPQVATWKGSWLYDGVIDVTGAVQLSALEIQSADQAGLLPPVRDDEWIGFTAAAT